MTPFMTTYDQKYRYGLEMFDQRNEEHDRMMMGVQVTCPGGRLAERMNNLGLSFLNEMYLMLLECHYADKGIVQ